MDITSLCRGCMKEVASWERGNFDARAVEMFSYCTQLRILEEDNLPQQFCYECIIKIESSYIFITEAQKVHVTLKNIISRTDTSIIVEPKANLESHNPVIKLTLPDYKICSVIEDSRLYESRKQQEKTEANIESVNLENIEDNVEPINDNELKDEKVVDEPEIAKNSHVCPVCRKSFMSKTWFSKHMQKEHVRKYKCLQCPKSFSRPSELTSHSVTHSEERNFACSACGKRFKRRKQLSVHMRAHGDARPYACDQCPARFKTKSVLKSHMSVHAKEKAFLCYYCGWSFAQAGNLKVHMRVHTGEKPHACATCPYRARAAAALRRHARAHVAPRAAAACARCGKLFHDPSNLARHIRTHTGALPYQCPSCPSAFSDSWKRKAHLMRTHKMALHDIPRMKKDGRVIQ